MLHLSYLEESLFSLYSAVSKETAIGRADFRCWGLYRKSGDKFVFLSRHFLSSAVVLTFFVGNDRMIDLKSSDQPAYAAALSNKASSIVPCMFSPNFLTCAIQAKHGRIEKRS